MRFLISNDDGIQSDGLRTLARALSEVGEVCVVAPDREQSAASHAISLHRPLRIHEVADDWWSVDGTPTDCVYLALHHLLKDRRPDVVVSGINYGANLADDVTYSGTVAAAMEGALLGVPAIAVSLVSRETFDFAFAAKFAAGLAAEVAERKLPRGMLLNVNVPRDPAGGYRFTKLGKRSYGSAVVENVDPRGRKYYWIGGSESKHVDIPGSDCNAVFGERLISVTPLHLDLTEYKLLDELRAWSVPGFDADERAT
ncbi:5'/3'-nucleotidase SurE [Vulgatibacter sp.]|uniref:5'/3'-nucleotidase SurE n=1 Tax=Vulgatibacter sp. TaxID=1971226 RepID=UPI0035634941